jgi:plasmid maintenance system antidote protein VapI
MNTERSELDPLTIEIIDKIVNELQKAWDNGKGLKQWQIAEKCQTSQKHINNLIHGNFRDRFTLDMAIKIWIGLGHDPSTFFPGQNIGETLINEKCRDTYRLFMEVISAGDKIDPEYLKGIESILKMVRAHIRP